MENKYTKLSALVNDNFRVDKVWGYKFKMWADGQMLVSDTYKDGYRKVYEVDTSKGKLDLGTGQIGSLLEAVFKNGVADLNNQTFSVKSNGKTGMDIRYYFNKVTTSPLPDKQLHGDEINVEDILF